MVAFVKRVCMRLIVDILLIFLLLACEKIEPQTNINEDKDSSLFNIVYSNEVLERAYQMANLEWTPLNPVPLHGGGYFMPGETVKGLPYSSVKEINTYLFQDVSYHTFMTAVHNPNSVLYSEDISKMPYHGRNCATYYGAVCSSAVMYAFGITIPYYANQIINLPEIYKLEHQVIDSLKVCDIIWRPGHVQMIYDLSFRADTLYQISTFESAGQGAHINNFSKAEFRKMWDENGYVGYRYNKLKMSEEEISFSDLAPIVYNDYLCPSKGDRSVYRTTDTVTINIFDPSFDSIVLSRGREIIATNHYSCNLFKYVNLKPGIYYACLQKDHVLTDSVSFEVIDISVNSVGQKSGDAINIYFHSSATAEYVALCDLSGSSQCFPLSERDRKLGYISVPRIDKQEYYCKVIFKGKYGRIINQPLRVE